MSIEKIELMYYNINSEVLIVENYFYINDFAFNNDKTKIEKLWGYVTDSNHDIFSPQREISRDEAMKLIKDGNHLFIHDGCYRKVNIKIVRVENLEYLRVDFHTHPLDYFG